MVFSKGPITGMVCAVLLLPPTVMRSAGSVCDENGGESASQTAERQVKKRPVTVSDAIVMTQLGDRDYNDEQSAKNDVARFSPDAEKFVIVVKRGNLEQNTNDYSLLLFRSTEALKHPAPEVLVSFSSSSNRPGIHAVKWLDNQTVTFLGENAGEVAQLYTVDCGAKRVRRLTNHSTSLVSYAISGKGSRLFFTAEKSAETLLNGRTMREGIVVSNQWLSDLISLKALDISTFFQDLFAQQAGSEREVLLRTLGVIDFSSLWLSPNGRYLILQTQIVDDPPGNWSDYDEHYLQRELGAKRAKGEALGIRRFELIDTETGETWPLLNSPIAPQYYPGMTAEVAWSGNSRSVVVSGTYLPLDVLGAERKLRQSNRFVAEIKIPSREIVPIVQGDMKLRGWAADSGTLLLETSADDSTAAQKGKLLAFENDKGRWKKKAISDIALNGTRGIAITVEEDMNTPPRIFVNDSRTGQQALLLDLNPQFGELKFGRVADISFTAPDGHIVRGGLFFPSEYTSGKRYPLVIQTHGWNPERFWIDGVYTTGSAAQPLASRGFVVLQLDEDLSKISTPDEVKGEMSAYEGAIDYLGGLGLIDRDRIGIVAFSRTGLGVQYALTHSKYHFAAATLADAGGSGYFEYLGRLTSAHSFPWDVEGINGGIPFGEGLSSWTKNSPGFNLDKVSAPVRLEVNGPRGVIFEWEWFAGLTRLGRPVELIYLPDASHVVVRPWERLVSQQGNVDWFCFWLRDEEDPAPEKGTQYARWRELRRLQEGRK
jgi:dipeptidyl aminopeptidase/acylaminoacyl peptidase